MEVIKKMVIKLEPVIMWEEVSDSYLHYLGMFLHDFGWYMEFIIEGLEDPLCRGKLGNYMGVEIEEHKATIYCPSDGLPNEHSPGMDRDCLLEMCRTWQVCVRQKVRRFIFLRDDRHITMIAEFDDKPISTQVFDYRVKSC